MKLGRVRGPLRNLRREGGCGVESLKLLKWSAETNRGPTYTDGHLDEWTSVFQPGFRQLFIVLPQNAANM